LVVEAFSALALSIARVVLLVLAAPEWARHDCSVNELPAGTVTFLFTDIERSTRLRSMHARQRYTSLKFEDGGLCSVAIARTAMLQ